MHIPIENPATIAYNRISYIYVPSQYDNKFKPLTICWCLHLSYLYFTMNDTTDVNLNARAMEKIKAPKKPEMALFVCICLKVIGKGLFIGVIDNDLVANKLI